MNDGIAPAMLMGRAGDGAPVLDPAPAVSDAGKPSDTESIDDLVTLISPGRRAALQGHCLSVIECMSSAARGMSTEHVRVMVDDALRAIRYVVDLVEREDARQATPPKESDGTAGHP